MSISNEPLESLRAQLLQKDQTIALQAQTIALLTQMLSEVEGSDEPTSNTQQYLNARTHG